MRSFPLQPARFSLARLVSLTHPFETTELYESQVPSSTFKSDFARALSAILDMFYYLMNGQAILQPDFLAAKPGQKYLFRAIGINFAVFAGKEW